MTIVFDVLDKTVLVTFRGKVRLLAGPFSDRKEAIAAGEDDWRQRGWVDVEVPKPA